MDKSMIVISVNVAYSIIYLIAFYIRHFQNSDIVLVTDDEIKAGLKKQVPFEYLAYSFIGLLGLTCTWFPLIRNGDVFNNWFPISFIIQFAVQFVVLLCFVLPDHKVFRYTASILVLTFPIFMGWNGLLKMNPRYSDLELTTMEVRKLTDDVTIFNSELTDRINKVNKDMNSVLEQIKKRQNEIESVNELLKSKQEQHEELSTIVKIDKDKAEEILNALNVHPPTILDRILDGLIGGVIGIILTILYRVIFNRWGIKNET